MVGSPAIPTASNLTQTPVRRICRAPFGWLVGKVLPDGLQIGASLSPALLNLNGEVLAVPRACNKPEFGPRTPVAATVTDGLGAYFRP